MSKIKTKQIDAYIAAPVLVRSFASANGASNNVTTAIASELATASNSGGAVDVVNASTYNTPGIIVGTTYKIRLVRSGTRKVITTSDGFEIYGKLTYSSPTYTLTYYYTNKTGSEVATNITGPITIDFLFYYQFKLKDLPVNSLTNMREFFRNVDEGKAKLKEFLRNILIRRTRKFILKWYGKEKSHVFNFTG